VPRRVEVRRREPLLLVGLGGAIEQPGGDVCRERLRVGEYGRYELVGPAPLPATDGGT
jgi:hypothetical protein